MLLTEEEIRMVCLGEGSYWVGEMDNSATARPPVLMPQFINVTKAQYAKDQAELERAVAEERKALGEYLEKRRRGDVAGGVIINDEAIQSLLQGESPEGVK